MLDVSREFSVPIITIASGPVAKSNSKALEYLQYLSKACNPITQLEQHLHISKPQVNQIKYDYKSKTKRETKTVQWWENRNRPGEGREMIGDGGSWDVSGGGGRDWGLERQERRVWACVNEKGWGLVVGECSKGMSGKAGIPQGSFKGLCGSVGSLTQCMAMPSPRRRLPQRQQWSARRGKRKRIGKRLNQKKPSSASRVSQPLA